jgi:hypothetical protein
LPSPSSCCGLAFTSAGGGPLVASASASEAARMPAAQASAMRRGAALRRGQASRGCSLADKGAGQGGEGVALARRARCAHSITQPSSQRQSAGVTVCQSEGTLLPCGGEAAAEVGIGLGNAMRRRICSCAARANLRAAVATAAVASVPGSDSPVVTARARSSSTLATKSSSKPATKDRTSCCSARARSSWRRTPRPARSCGMTSAEQGSRGRSRTAWR